MDTSINQRTPPFVGDLENQVGRRRGGIPKRLIVLLAPMSENYLANSWLMSLKDLNSNAFPQGSKNNIVACSPTSPLKRM